jgi:hypothetical protein
MLTLQLAIRGVAMDRRRFLKYAGLCVAVAGSALAGYEFDEWQASQVPAQTRTVSETTTETLSQTLNETVTQTITETTTELLHSLNYYLSLLEAKGVDPYVRLAKELRKLPELSNLNAASNELDLVVLRATGTIVETVLGADQSGLTALESMLDEGIPNRRKFCTPLQAWLWIAIDGKDFNPLENYSLENLLTAAWLNTSTSNRLYSNRWSYAEAKDRVNSPELVNWFVFHYLTFDMVRDSVHPQDDVVTYQVRFGVCRHAAYVATAFLTHNGYEAKDVTFICARNEGHSVSAARLSDGIWVVVDFRGEYLPMQGPFKSYTDVAYYIRDSFGWKTTYAIYVEDNYQIMERNND